ncbi:MAG: dTMP kinase [Nocardioidaceae bacterium]
MAFEGGEGAGKSTQARALATRLRERGYDVILTHEPGDSASRAQSCARFSSIRRPVTFDSRAETLLYAADKAEHVERLIRPALARGAVVITDQVRRFDAGLSGCGSRSRRQRDRAHCSVGHL